MKEIIKKIHSQACLIGACKKFRGNESLEQLVQLFLSPQGLEFCIDNHFPHISTLRLLKGENLERYGIYIDAGDITLTNPGKVVLIGRTNAQIKCDTMEYRNQIYLMHNASATVNAYGHSVTFVVADRGNKCIKNAYDHAIIL